MRFGHLSTWSFDAAAKRCEITIMDAIGAGFFGDGVRAGDIAKILENAKGAETLELILSSPGGDVFEGVAIYNAIARFPAKSKTARIDGLAASIASVIALACDRRVTAKNARWMIHEARYRPCQNLSAKEARKLAEEIDQTNGLMADTYAERTGQKREDVLAWMAEETWMNADLAKARGFTHEIVDGTGKATAHAGHAVFQLFAHVPDDLRTAVPPPAAPATQPQETRMKTLLNFLALADTASEADALAAATKMKAGLETQIESLTALLALTGKSSAAEAAGIIGAWKSEAEKVPGLTQRLAQIEADGEAREVERLIAAANADHRLTPAKEPKAREFLKAHGFKAFTAYIGMLNPEIAPEVKPPVTPVAPVAAPAQAAVFKVLGVDPTPPATK